MKKENGFNENVKDKSIGVECSLNENSIIYEEAVKDNFDFNLVTELKEILINMINVPTNN